MRSYAVDLHNHTPYVHTDYRAPHASPEDLVAAAFSAGIEMFGVTDHYSIAWYEQVRLAAEEHSMQDGQRLIVLPGSEMKITWGDDELHLLALFEPELAALQFAGMMSWLRLVEDIEDPARLPWVKAERDPVEVVQRATELGAICYLGHADRRFGEYTLWGRPLLDRLLLEAPLAAVELLSLENAEELSAKAPGMTFIRSSDAHSPRDIGRRTTDLQLREPTFAALRDGLFASRLAR